jgi:anti-anti-sigma factor
VHWLGQVAVVPLPSEIDIANADPVRGGLLSVLHQGPAVLIADLSTTTFCGSCGVRTLVQVHRQAKAAGAAVRLVITARGILRVLAITGADQLMDIYPSVEAAAAAPAPPCAAPEPAPQGNADQHVAMPQDVPGLDVAVLDGGQPETAAP